MRTSDDPPMPTRVKRTYNLNPATVRAVREMASSYHVAGSQDAVIELAIDELQRRLQDEQESAAWKTAAHDPAFVAGARDLEDAF